MPSPIKYTRRNTPLRKRRPTKITIPTGVSPYVKLVFAEMRRQGLKYDEIEIGSGVLRSTLKAWRHKNKPGLESIEAVFGFLGWTFVPIPGAKALPAALVADLQRVAADHRQSIEGVVEHLMAIVSGIKCHPPRDAIPSAPKWSTIRSILFDGDRPRVFAPPPNHPDAVPRRRSRLKAAIAADAGRHAH